MDARRAVLVLVTCVLGSMGGDVIEVGLGVVGAVSEPEARRALTRLDLSTR